MSVSSSFLHAEENGCPSAGKGGECVYKEIGRVLTDALQSWDKTLRLCLILFAVAAAGTVALLVM